MSRVDQAGPVSKILHYLFESYIKFSMCSYERVGWLGSRDLGFSNRDLAKRAGKFCHMNTSAQLPGWKGDVFFVTAHARIHLNCSDTAIS